MEATLVVAEEKILLAKEAFRVVQPSINAVATLQLKGQQETPSWHMDELNTNDLLPFKRPILRV
jgi:hypothetical protein